MKNPYKYSDSNKRYYAFSYYLKQKYGCKVAKISLDGGFTCPNIDGTKSTGGCTYCSGRGSGDFAGNRLLSLKEQFDDVCMQECAKWDNPKFIPYFQAFTNTYAPVDVLRKKYEEVLNFPNIVGIAIATRADCINEEIADLLYDISQKTDLTVELGLQSVFDTTGEHINRCHSYAEFLDGFHLLHDRGIDVCVHIINGLPGETHQMMLHTAREIAKLPIHSVKIHLLHVIKHTKMADDFLNGEFKLMTRDEYVSVVCDQIEVLRPDTVIQRITGDGKASDLIGPIWSIKKLAVMNEIDKEFVRRDSYQGKFYNKY